MHFSILSSLLGPFLLLNPEIKICRNHPAVAIGPLEAQATAMPLPPMKGKQKLDETWTPHDDINNEEETTIKYIAHAAPQSTYLILNSPAIASFVLVKGWKNKESLQSLTAAVQSVVEHNPVLSGRATCAKNWWKDPTITIEMNGGTQKGQSFVTVMDKSNALPKLPEDTACQLAYIDKHITPLVGKTDSTLHQIETKSPLFEVKVVLLPDNYACIYSKMSHCIGDFVTYYELLDQISALDKGDTAKPINWDNPLKKDHEIFPEDLSRRDLERLYGIPFILGLATHMPVMPFRKQRVLLLSEDKVKEKKKELKEKGYKGMTSNSIITAALCDANRSTDIFAMTRSMRGITPGLGLRDGGNLHCEIPFQRCAGRNPLVIQDIVEKGKYFEPGEVPFWSSVTGKVGRISNCVVPMNHMSFGGCQPICYCPAKSFLDFTPLDTAVIFRVSKGQDAVLHNFQNMKTSGMLNDLLLED